MPKKPQNQNDLRANLHEAYQSLQPYLSLGLTIAVTIVVFLFIGHWLDSRWNTEPWLTLAGGIVGIFLGFTYMYYTVRSLLTSPDKKSDDHQQSSE